MKHKISMNIANKLTLLRMFMVPIFIIIYLTSWVPSPWNRYLALAIFAIASYTDHLDGMLARRMNLVSDFGKFMDPLADKLLVCSALICFVESGELAAWIVIILIGREFIISGFRLVAAGKGKVIAAGWLGKIKTVLQMFAVMFIILGVEAAWYQIITQILIYASVVMAVVSVIDYICRNISVLYEE